MHLRALAMLAVLACACGGAASRGPTTALRAVCPAGERWDGAACVTRGGGDDLAAAAAAVRVLDIDTALAALDRAEARPLEHADYLRLWETRGVTHASAEQVPEARAAFGRLLDVDPGHAIDCNRGAPVFRPFQDERAQTTARRTPELELRWRRDLRLGQPVPIEIENVADPAGMLRGLTVYVRARGDTGWRAADVAMPAPGKLRTLVLPPVTGTRPTALEVYAVAEDERGNEVHLWASPARPREIPLRYDPKVPWYRTWWVWAAVGGVAAVGTGIGVYAAVWKPSDRIDAPVNLRW